MPHKFWEVPGLSCLLHHKAFTGGLYLWAVEADTDMDQPSLRSLQPHRCQHQVSLHECVCICTQGGQG